MVKGLILLFIAVVVAIQIYIIEKEKCEVKIGSKIIIDTTNNIRISGTVVKTTKQGITINYGGDVYLDWKNIKHYKICNIQK